MKGDFSRQTFNRSKHYSGVLMQQGRVQTDADWNEQWALNGYRLETEGADIIGACGAPQEHAGFGVSADGKNLILSAGRYYVDGILVENDQDKLDYLAQPDLLDAPKLTEIPKKRESSTALVYLDVWYRHITALDDPLIRETALGGPDTATRVKAVWQVKILPVKSQKSDPTECDRLKKVKERLERDLQKANDSKNSADIQRFKDALVEVNEKIARVCGGTSGCESEFAEWDALIAPSTGKLNARTAPPQDTDNDCLIPPSAGYRRLENQLYRVEIHHGGSFPSDAVTFKWSRDNGTVVTLIEKISGQGITVHDVGPDDVLGFANGQFVEVIDDAVELNGLPGQLIQIDSVDLGTRVIKLKSAPTLTFNAARHPKLRRWDSAGEIKIENASIPLEAGIEVHLSNGTYKTGDYWLIPARTATGEIEWPPFAGPNSAPLAQTPVGIRHHYCRLALVSLTKEKLAVLADCRHMFPPLTELAPAKLQAIHVAATNWVNDDSFQLDQMLRAGLRIRLDAAPDPISVSSATMIVTMEQGQGADALGSGAALGALVVLEGKAELDPAQSHSIRWHPETALGERLRQLFKRAGPGSHLRVRVTLKGHTVWNAAAESRFYLDGQAFGKTGVRTDGKTPRIDLNLPSGSGARASDFESWFYLGV